jgi:Tfp pilus assembly protein PilO
MSALGDLASTVSGGLWKVVSVVLLVLLVAVGCGTGFGWWLAAHDLDQARADLKAEQVVAGKLRSELGIQNAAVAALGREKKAADERRAAAEQLAAANGRRFDTALAGLAGVKATTCAEAMPAVNKMLEAIR